MRTVLSTRRAKFYRLIHQANEQPSDWLVAVLKDKRHNNGLFSPVARLACLRILVCRDHGLQKPSGLPYPQRKAAVRAALGI